MMDAVDLHPRNLRLIDGSTEGASRPWLLVHSMRTLFLVCVLVVSVVYQVQLGNFLNVEMWLPIYAVLMTVFSLNSIYLLMWDRLQGHGYWNAALFGLDTVAVTLLIYFAGAGQFLFLFLYLINLILAGLIFDREGSWLLTVWTSICFSGLLILSPDVSGQNLYFSLVINNLAFGAVSFIGGRLNEQLSKVGTQLQETRSDLRALQDLNELIVNNITNGILVVSRTGFVQFFNSRAAQVLGADHFQQLKVQEVIPEMGWPWTSLIKDESRAFERREIRLERGHDFKVLEVTVARFFESPERVKGWIFIIDDRTEQKALEDGLRQQEKLAAVGQLAAGIAHEIRNPLASISGSVQLMLGNPTVQDEESLKLMRIVDKEINRLNGLITEFLEYVRPEAKPVQPVDVNVILREVLEALQFNSKLRKDVEQRLKLNSKSDIAGNADKLKQAFLNLIINAYQAMDKTQNPRIEVETFDQPDSVLVIIRDNGCGIKKANLHRVFEPFHTTKAQGTGLGLAVTHKILLAHGATVTVDSEEGEGAKFTLEFPADRGFHTEDLIPLKRVSKG